MIPSQVLNLRPLASPFAQSFQKGKRIGEHNQDIRVTEKADPFSEIRVIGVPH